MGRLKLTTDMGDWSMLPVRIRAAFIALVISASLVGPLAAFDLVSFPFAVVLVAAVGIVWEVVFDRRRRWWSEEPSLADDPIGRNASRNIVWFAGAAVVVVVLLALKVLSA